MAVIQRAVKGLVLGQLQAVVYSLVSRQRTSMRLLIIKLCFWLIRQLTPAPHTVLRAKGRRPLQILHVEKSDFSIIGGLPRQRYRVSSKQHESQREWPVRYMNQGMLDGDFWLVRVGDGRWRGKSKWGL